jgi:hypothetical protein
VLSWLRAWAAPALAKPWGPIGFEHSTQAEQLQPLATRLDELQGNALPIGRQAELLGFLAGWQEQGMLLSSRAIFNHRLTPSSLLDHYCQIPSVPAQRRRTVGLAVAEMA